MTLNRAVGNLISASSFDHGYVCVPLCRVRLRYTIRVRCEDSATGRHLSPDQEYRRTHIPRSRARRPERRRTSVIYQKRRNDMGRRQISGPGSSILSGGCRMTSWALASGGDPCDRTARENDGHPGEETARGGRATAVQGARSGSRDRKFGRLPNSRHRCFFTFCLYTTALCCR